MGSVSSADISIHAPREGSDASFRAFCWASASFLSTLPARGATVDVHTGQQVVRVFLSTLPARGATGQRRPPAPPGKKFLSTLPARGATMIFFPLWISISYFYPRSPRGERRHGIVILPQCIIFLSTLPARGATYPILPVKAPQPFLSTLPARGATSHKCRGPCPAKFLSTLPARGATRSPQTPGCGPGYFYPRSPRGERRGRKRKRGPGRWISIHAPREGSDLASRNHVVLILISIHAPREGSDARIVYGRNLIDLFLSTLPARGATVLGSSLLPRWSSFLSTLPARGATS